MTKSELVEMLSDYSDNAQVIFNVDADVDARNQAFTVNHISYLDDDFIPILSSEKPCPKIIIHLKEKKNI